MNPSLGRISAYHVEYYIELAVNHTNEFNFEKVRVGTKNERLALLAVYWSNFGCNDVRSKQEPWMRRGFFVFP